MSTENQSRIREDVLGDPRYPVHSIANKLRPYLSVLVEKFHPQQVILFGSYAYGKPDHDSDVDLLVVMEMTIPPLQEAIAIRKAWRAARRAGESLPFDMVLESPEGHETRVQEANGFYDTISSRGLRLV